MVGGVTDGLLLQVVGATEKLKKTHTSKSINRKCQDQINRTPKVVSFQVPYIAVGDQSTIYNRKALKLQVETQDNPSFRPTSCHHLQANRYQ
jgi:uncharacterized protein YcfJ